MCDRVRQLYLLTYVAGRCILLFEVACRHEAASPDAHERPLRLRRESLTAWHLPSRQKVELGS